MALFNRDYDRDYGYRGTNRGFAADNRNRDNRGFGDRMRSGWNEVKSETREFFGGDNDRDINRGYQNYNSSGYRNDTGYRNDVGYRNDNDTGFWNDNGYRGGTGYAGGTGYGAGTGNTGYNRDYNRSTFRGGWGNTNDYDRDYGYNAETTGYDRNYKSRAQTDFGDPFGDRQSRTPIRMIRGEYEGGYDNNFRAGNRNEYEGAYDNNFRSGNRGFRGNTYDRDYGANPMGYDPYYDRGMNRNY